MSATSCPHEEAVTAAARSGDWSPELKTHRDSCVVCAELTLVVAALAADAEELEAIDRPLPDPAPIWLRARLASRERDLQRATRAIVWVQRAAVAVALAIGIAFAPGFWQLMAGAFANLGNSVSLLDVSRAGGSPLLVFVVSMLVLGGLALWELTVAREN
jgi:nucleoside-diphosphate-sugar epimerase